ncbi:preprotein translocase subunit YajC [Gemmiger sp. An120]|uniref:preprotein translocase subunit YajC n=1 Tax=Gemmiger sp. An120 TaxID=1965549 RepID=UPI000B39BEE9|nr:preprotein translocase subunit YajC [Gemmiger sp. An120]OUQ43946.1 preprotein translocase subunit YajC [Gemmiger sp. An120]
MTPEMLQIVFMLVILGGMFFFMYRSQKKQQKKETEMRNSIEIGDEVTTIGGIVGRVVALKEDTFVLETGSDRVKIRFRRTAIGSVNKLDMDAGSENK